MGVKNVESRVLQKKIVRVDRAIRKLRMAEEKLEREAEMLEKALARLRK